MIGYYIGRILLVEAVLLLLPTVVALLYSFGVKYPRVPGRIRVQKEKNTVGYNYAPKQFTGIDRLQKWVPWRPVAVIIHLITPLTKVQEHRRHYRRCSLQ